eukprot:TRINITY_DN10485_c0_g1_i1.p1 TRINITY_DN10485_c0_g1~~TRINITY_DN10485_c0_g1_i1.p1  ORF type:complete len:179 (-),score=36.77 TRINITY_DN10485_c0_g1_i1:29-565(-)
MTKLSLVLKETGPRRIRTTNKETYFNYYRLRIGEISMITSLNDCVYILRPGTLPAHVYKAAERFGINLRRDGDLGWVFYLWLLTPPPPSSGMSKYYVEFNVEKYYDFILGRSFGDYPGDEYFQNLLNQMKFRRNDKFVNLNERQRYVYCLNNSWLKFKRKDHVKFYFNCLTEEARAVS